MGNEVKGNGVMGYSKIAPRALLYFLQQPFQLIPIRFLPLDGGRLRWGCPSSRYSITPFFSLRRDEFRIELIIG